MTVAVTCSPVFSVQVGSSIYYCTLARPIATAMANYKLTHSLYVLPNNDNNNIDRDRNSISDSDGDGNSNSINIIIIMIVPGERARVFNLRAPMHKLSGTLSESSFGDSVSRRIETRLEHNDKIRFLLKLLT